MREKLLHFPCVSRIHSTSERKNPPDFRSSGYFDLRLLDGTKVHASASWKKLKRVEHASTLLIERRKGDSSPTFALA
ncbi:hypothetical protein B1693_07295 [Geobacillus zalihae]|nr:hypothetical protein B1693_07295 [Geobacillus zalihae]